YYSDTAAGRLLPFRLDSQRWDEPIPIPGYGSIFGYVGGGVTFQGRGYYSLSTYRYASKLDPKTNTIIAPPDAHIGVDGYDHRFLDRTLVFDPVARAFDFLAVPPQADGIPLVCYMWSDATRLVITGSMIQFGEFGKPPKHGHQFGDWLVWQNSPAEREPPLPIGDFSWNREQHLAAARREYPADFSLYLSHPATPPIDNMRGSPSPYPVGKDQALLRRAAKTNADAFFGAIVDRYVAPGMSDGQKVAALMGCLHRQLFYNPVRLIMDGPNYAMRALAAHDAHCGAAAEAARELLKRAGVESRDAPLHHHIAVEAFYDDAWHFWDPLFFGDNPITRDKRVLSLAELKADPYYADAWPQTAFAFDPELLRSQDGFYVLGYNFGEWGWEPYYSFYLGAEKDTPPTLPVTLPAVRLGGNRLKLRWAESVKRGGGDVSYEVTIASDRLFAEPLFQAELKTNWVEWDAPRQNRMYFFAVRALDSHRQKNPRTWYPRQVGNFVLVPETQYGWFGVF
ncbi:MAG: hypothetical protein HY343_08335, partial [Lentisphaerae bacterium]|nr:hypothetical protein [Lentisphaerota bacterium]